MKAPIIAKTQFGLEPLLSEELEALGGKNIKVLNRAVSFEGDKQLLYKANLHSRFAARILVPVKSFLARDTKNLYVQCKRIDWSFFLSTDKTFAIDAVTYGEKFTHSHFIAQTLKDAIVDQFKEREGTRPNVDKERPDLLINIHISDFRVNISLDSSGHPLNQRGYRTESNDAPLSEILAAALIKFTRWDGSEILIDGMTGSGTLAIEAAMIQRNIAPGLRRRFGFQNWNDYNSELFETLIEEAQSHIKPAEQKIHARDLNMGNLAIARRNAERAGVLDNIVFDCVDFMKSDPIDNSGMVILNPPYGERMEKKLDMDDFYHKMGFRLKHNYPNHTAWIISSNLAAMKRIGLKPEQRIKLYNGKLECRFNEYKLFKGKRIDHLEKTS